MSDFFGADDIPVIDFAIFVFVDTPADTGGPEPAELIGCFIEIRVDIAVNFDAAGVIAPAIQFFIPIGIDKPSQRLAGWSGNQESFAIWAF